MRLHRILTGLVFCGLSIGLAGVANADDPPKPNEDILEPTTTPSPRRGDFDPVSIQSGTLILDPSTAHITQLELDEDDKSLVPAASPPAPSPSIKGRFTPGAIVLGHFDGEKLQIVPNGADMANEQLVGSLTQRSPIDHELSAASSTIIKSESFEGVFPGEWTLADDNGTANGEYLWGDVPCFPIESSGSWSGWPADRGADGLNLGSSDCGSISYPDNVASWLMYGPFSLADAQSASFDLFFRMVSQSCDPITACDFLYWGASTNGINFAGDFAAGTYTSGPFNSGYNFVSLDLSYLAGQPQVWIAVAFVSNGDGITSQGPFVDAISLRKNTDARSYITQENFDVMDFPNQLWESFDNDGPTNGDYRWDDVSCFARSDGWSMWPADEGADGVNVCTGADYPNYAWSWLRHGPFNLSGASEAWVDFYFRNESEQNYDYLLWMVSKDGSDFSGYGISGTYLQGPYNNGYNFMRLDLSDVPDLGDLRGESQVWLAFIFESDFSNTGQGPFIDDVSVVVERPVSTKIFLPIVLKPPAAPITNLHVENQTTGAVSYTVKNTPQGNITCTNIPTGATVLCGSFDAGSYEVSVSTSQCGSNSGEVSFPAGDVTRVVRCVSD